jgi:hypothetical protein
MAQFVTYILLDSLTWMHCTLSIILLVDACSISRNTYLVCCLEGGEPTAEIPDPRQCFLDQSKDETASDELVTALGGGTAEFLRENLPLYCTRTLADTSHKC